jgi:hypothetical protein
MTFAQFLFIVNGKWNACQEQIEMSGFEANELSAFSVLLRSLIFKQEESGGRTFSSMIMMSWSYPQTFFRSLCGAWRVADNFCQAAFSGSFNVPCRS